MKTEDLIAETKKYFSQFEFVDCRYRNLPDNTKAYCYLDSPQKHDTVYKIEEMLFREFLPKIAKTNHDVVIDEYLLINNTLVAHPALLKNPDYLNLYVQHNNKSRFCLKQIFKFHLSYLCPIRDGRCICFVLPQKSVCVDFCYEYKPINISTTKTIQALTLRVNIGADNYVYDGAAITTNANPKSSIFQITI